MKTEHSVGSVYCSLLVRVLRLWLRGQGAHVIGGKGERERERDHVRPTPPQQSARRAPRHQGQHRARTIGMAHHHHHLQLHVL